MFDPIAMRMPLRYLATLLATTGCGLTIVIASAAPAEAAQPPPAGVHTTAVTCDRVDLAWTAPVGGVGIFAYKVFRDDAFLTWVLAPATTVTDDAVTGPHTYTYTVTTVGTDGMMSGPSAAAVVAVPSCTDQTPPSTPRLTSVVPSGCTAAVLTWAAASDAESGLREYRIHRNGAVVRLVTPTSTTTVDGGLAPSTAYAYAVSAVDAAGNASPASAPVTIVTPTCGTNQAPIANAGTDRTAPTFTTLTFDGRASHDADGSIVAYRWDLGDGDVASGSVITHVFRTRGTYTVRLTVTDDDGLAGSDVALVTVTNRPPVANAGADQTVAVGAPVSFNGRASFDLDGTIASYLWSFGDGGTATGPLVTRSYAEPGTYVVRLVVTDDAGASAADTAVITVAADIPDETTGELLRFGGIGADIGQGIAFDAAGNVVVGGRFADDAEIAGHPLQPTGSANGLIAKLSPGGNPLWVRPLPTTDASVVEAVAVDAAGDVAVAGWFRGSIDLGAGFVNGVEGLDIFVAKYAGATGALRWGRVIGGTRTDSAYAVTTDPAGNVILVGTFQRTVDFGGGGLASRLGGLDLFVAKYRSGDGAHLWSESFWNFGDDIAYGVATDGTGDVFITGFFGSAIDFGGGVINGSGTNNAFVAKLAGSNGAHRWSHGLASSASGRGYAIATDRVGNVAVTGFFEGTLTLGGHTMTATGLSDTFVAKYAGGDGHNLWGINLPNDGTDVGYGLAIDGGGSVAVTGQFWGDMTLGSQRITSLGRSDIFVARLSGTSGAPSWADAYGGLGNDYGYAIATTPDGRLAITGYFSDEALFGADEAVSAGTADGFVRTVAP